MSESAKLRPLFEDETETKRRTRNSPPLELLGTYGLIRAVRVRNRYYLRHVLRSIHWSLPLREEVLLPQVTGRGTGELRVTVEQMAEALVIHPFRLSEPTLSGPGNRILRCRMRQVAQEANNGPELNRILAMTLPSVKSKSGFRPESGPQPKPEPKHEDFPSPMVVRRTVVTLETRLSSGEVLTAKGDGNGVFELEGLFDTRDGSLKMSRDEAAAVHELLRVLLAE